MATNKIELKITERGTTDRKLAESVIGEWSGYEVCFSDGTKFTVDRGTRGRCEVVTANDDGDDLTIWVKQ